MSSETESNQRIVSRKRSSYLWPRIFLAATAANLAWEIIKKNLDSNIVKSWPWRLTLLDISTSAALASAVLALLLARSQLARTHRPVINYSSFPAKSLFIKKVERIIHVRNAGAGHAVVHTIKYRYRPADPRSGAEIGPTSDWMDWYSIVDELEDRHLKNFRDYALPRIGSGATLPLSSTVDTGMELVTFTKRAMLALAQFDVLLRIEDTLGDQHEQTLVCMSRRHREEVREEVSRKRSLFRR